VSQQQQQQQQQSEREERGERVGTWPGLQSFQSCLLIACSQLDDVGALQPVLFIQGGEIPRRVATIGGEES